LPTADLPELNVFRKYHDASVGQNGVLAPKRQEHLVITAWKGLQQLSKAALIALVVVVGVALGMEVVGDGPSLGITAGFVAAAAVLVVYTEYTAAKQG
jgi:hypothetical protein